MTVVILFYYEGVVKSCGEVVMECMWYDKITHTHGNINIHSMVTDDICHDLQVQSYIHNILTRHAGYEEKPLNQLGNQSIAGLNQF